MCVVGGARHEPMMPMGGGDGRSKAELLNEDVVDASWTECGQCCPKCGHTGVCTTESQKVKMLAAREIHDSHVPV